MKQPPTTKTKFQRHPPSKMNHLSIPARTDSELAGDGLYADAAVQGCPEPHVLLSIYWSWSSMYWPVTLPSPRMNHHYYFPHMECSKAIDKENADSVLTCVTFCEKVGENCCKIVPEYYRSSMFKTQQNMTIPIICQECFTYGSCDLIPYLSDQNLQVIRERTDIEILQKNYNTWWLVEII